MQVKQQDEAMHASLDEVMDIQFALDFIRGRIQHAGFTPCRALHALQIVDHRQIKTDMTSLSILPKELVCRRMDESFTWAYARPHSRRIKLAKALKLRSGQLVLVADCEHAELHVVAEVKHMAQHVYVELQSPLMFDYPSSFYISPWIEERFLIRARINNEKALMYRNEHAEVLSVNVQDMLVTREADIVKVIFESKRHGQVMMQTRLRMP